jgi:hypothetical protein
VTTRRAWVGLAAGDFGIADDAAAAARCDVNRTRPGPPTSFRWYWWLGPAESIHNVATQEVHVHLDAEPRLWGHLQPAIAVVQGRGDEVERPRASIKNSTSGRAISRIRTVSLAAIFSPCLLIPPSR